MRQYFIERVQANEYEVIDMQPRFISRHRRDGSRFEFTLDAHWNGLMHQELLTRLPDRECSNL